jgi:hypothetical protein
LNFQKFIKSLAFEFQFYPWNKKKSLEARSGEYEMGVCGCVVYGQIILHREGGVSGSIVMMKQPITSMLFSYFFLPDSILLML